LKEDVFCFGYQTETAEGKHVKLFERRHWHALSSLPNCGSQIVLFDCLKEDRLHLLGENGGCKVRRMLFTPLT
jgi:hypothetical protein